MKKSYLSILAIMAVLLSGCHWIGIRGNGQIVTDKRAVTEFSDIKTGGAFEIEWHPGPPSLSITTDSNLLRYIENRVEGKTINLESHEQMSPTGRIRVVVAWSSVAGVSHGGGTRLAP